MFEGLFNKKKTDFSQAAGVDFADIHCHLLCGVDDGAADYGTMTRMIDMAYEDGVRAIAFTPHIRDPWLKRPDAQVLDAFVKAIKYVRKKYPGMQSAADKPTPHMAPEMNLALGCEVYYTPDVFDRYEDIIRPYTLVRPNIGAEHVTLEPTDYLLIEFSTRASDHDILRGLQDAQSRGYIPILAHIERYPSLWMDDRKTFSRKLTKIYDLLDLGVRLQVNCDTIVAIANLKMSGGSRSSAMVPVDKTFKKKMDELLTAGAISFLSTDAHDAEERTPIISGAYEYVADLCGEEYAADICGRNAMKILNGKYL